ncbi:MAG TPA: protein-glutamate O-methyltransferase CheR [Nitrospirota bacterium]|nr:protein-glutamate O-methyltransferase CheR [Nitrospirota bacterium]
MIKLQADEFKVLAKYVYALSGIYLDESKAYLIETRLEALVRELGCASYSELYYRATADKTLALTNKIIDAITTNETLFFRDQVAFDLIRHKVLPDLIDGRNRKTPAGKNIALKIWSAACSTGQEVYSIAIVLKELLSNLSGYDISILGTDISDAAISRASYGCYSQHELDRGFPRDKVAQYLTQDNGRWKIRDDLRALARFRKMNLHESFNGIGSFDLILCRNVAIYFTEDDRRSLFDRMGKALESDGCLIIGSTESLSGCCPKYEPKRYLRSVYYQYKP